MNKLLIEALDAKRGLNEIRKIENRITKIKADIWKVLENKYEYYFNDLKKRELDWDFWNFNSEFQMILRSALRKDKVIHIQTENGERFNLTSKHGFKFPKTWRGYDFLPSNWDCKNGTKAELKNEILFKDNINKIDFSCLRNNDSVSVKKLMKFFYFLRKFLQLYKSRIKIDEQIKNFPTKESDRDKIDDLKKIYQYSDLDSFIEFLRNEKVIKISYDLYVKNYSELNQEQKLLYQEMHDYNKPFRILLTLKKTE